MATIRAIAGWFNRRRRAVAFVFVGWIVVVVVGSGRTPAAGEWLTVPDLGGVLAAVVGSVALASFVVILYLRVNRSEAFVERSPRPLRAIFLTAVVVLLVAIAFVPEPPTEELLSEEAEVTRIVVGGKVGETEGQSGDGTDGDLIALLVIAVIAGAVLLRRRRRPTPIPHPEMERGDDLERGLGTAIDAAADLLQVGSDARMAVLAAYDSLERALTDLGQPRDPAETPSEHLARVLAVVPPLTRPAVRLGRLYELARFSDHPIPNDDRDSAADALAAARSTLISLASEAP